MNVMLHVALVVAWQPAAVRQVPRKAPLHVGQASWSYAASSSYVHTRSRQAMSPVEMLSGGDTAAVTAAALLLGAAGWLQYSVSSGEKGINAFLMKEKGS